MKIIVVGSGYMAREYLRVLTYLKWDAIVVGKSELKVKNLREEFPQFTFYSGGIKLYLENIKFVTDFAINAVSISELKETSISLLEAGVKYLLLEKPGDLSVKGLQEIYNTSKKYNSKVWIAYNRRFYSSVKALLHEIEIDGGISSVNFEFTEWIHTIDTKIYDNVSLNRWILANSSHVIDTVFYIIGLPKILHTIVQGQNEIEWHSSGSIFCGSGISVNNVPFTYHSNWCSPGRWTIEVLTKKRRFYLKPMEKLQVQVKGSVQINEHLIDDKNDIEFKPGIFLQTQSFINLDTNCLLAIEEQIEMMPYYEKIGGY